MKIGVLGGGQLGRMLGLAGIPMGIEFRFMDPANGAPAEAVGKLIVAPFSDAKALDELADWADVVTYEFENVPVSATQHIAQSVPVWPPSDALLASQDRLAEKKFFRGLGIRTAPFEPVESPEELRSATEKLGFPCVLKTRRMGYDGKGQCVLRSASDLTSAFDALGGVPLILEGFIQFSREVSSIAVRGVDGEMGYWALCENVHRDGILRTSISPPRDTLRMEVDSKRHMQSIMQTLGYVGVLTVEWFVTEDGLVANEMAPRVHNSGHLTIEGAETSQFENHVRAIAGMPLGSCSPRGWSAMVNIVGAEPESKLILTQPNAHLHRYGKSPRKGRKLGHVTLRVDDQSNRDRLLAELLPLIP